MQSSKFRCLMRGPIWYKLLLIVLLTIFVYFYSAISIQTPRTVLPHMDRKLIQDLLKETLHFYQRTDQSSSPANPTQTKVILAYTHIYGQEFDISKYGRTNGERAQAPNPFARCEYPCSWTTDRTLINSSDAVLFHLYNNLQNKDFVADLLPKHANQSQKWIFMAREPQAFYFPEQLKHLDDMFNLTVTFQRESDVWIPYGSYWKLPEQNQKEDINYFTNSANKQLVAWMSSNCVTSSRREDYVKELQKYIQVDVYGACGTIETPPNEEYNFREVLAKKYKFYLAFENSDCTDYVTEKFWLNSLQQGMIPIVRGAKVDYKAIAPPNSYIHADTFITPEKLADYLKIVASNEILFNSYHQWRKTYGAGYQFFTTNRNWMCDLCEKVHTSKPQTWKISEHFGEDSRCFTYQRIRNRTGEHMEDIFRQ